MASTTRLRIEGAEHATGMAEDTESSGETGFGKEHLGPVSKMISTTSGDSSRCGCTAVNETARPSNSSVTAEVENRSPHH